MCAHPFFVVGPADVVVGLVCRWKEDELTVFNLGVLDDVEDRLTEVRIRYVGYVHVVMVFDQKVSGSC